MRFKHRDVEYVLPDEWWDESGIQSASQHAFVSGPSPWPNLPVFELAVDDIRPVVRKASHGVFNDNIEFGTAHDRVVRILRGFCNRSAIPPIEVASLRSDLPPRYKLMHGAHRLYCSIAAGYSHVPAVEVIDFFGTYHET